MTEFYGKYRGKVINNIDPLMLGRLMALVPAMSDLPLSWAMPCVPYAGRNIGFYFIPQIGSNVWIEFESGDINYPIWTGCFWGDDEAPAKPALPTTKMIKTETVTLEINDLTTTFSLEVATPVGPVKLVQGPEGIALTIGSASLKVTMQGVDLAIPASKLSVTPEGITLKNASATAEVTPASVDLKNAAASISLSPSSIDIKNGAASVALSPASVSLNNGALEVI